MKQSKEMLVRTAATATVRGLGLGAIVLALAGCASNPPPFQPLALEHLETSSATDTNAPMRPLPTTLESPYLPPVGPNGRGNARQAADKSPTTLPTTGPNIGNEGVPLTLQEVVQRTVLNNPDVKVAGYTPAIDQTRVVEAQAQFDPQWFANTNFAHQNAPPGGFSGTNSQQGNFNNASRMDQLSVGTGIRQILSSGGQYEVSYQVAYADAYTVPSFFENSLILSITQPLLQNFGQEVNSARINVARNNQKISLLNFRDTLEDTLDKVEQTYWQLVLAQRQVEITEQLLRTTEDTASILAARLKGGVDVSRLQTSQANSAVESRRAVLVRAKANVRDLSDQLKRFMNDPQFPITGPAVILPATPPVTEPLHMDLTDQIQTAMLNRIELAQQKLRIDSSTIAVRVAKNALLPQLNLTARASVDGIGDDLGEPVDGQFDTTSVSGGIGLEFVIPIGNRAARAQWTRSLLQRQQAIAQYTTLIEQISLEVRQAERNVRTSWDEMVATGKARFSAADSLLAVQQRREANEPLTPTFVQLELDRQAALADAASAEARARSNYNTALIELERRKGTLLRYNNISLQEQAIPFTQQLFNDEGK